MSDRVQALREAVDNYEGTVLSLLAFVNEALWDRRARRRIPDARVSFGRRMTTSAKNRVMKSTTVTPDAVVQPTPSYGIVAEAKTCLPRQLDSPEGRERLQELRDQVVKYDDDLTGWFTKAETLGVHDIALLVDMSRCVHVAEDLKAHKKDMALQRKVCVVATERSGETKAYVTLKAEYGSLTDASLHGALKHVVKVPVASLLQELLRMKFCDSKPDNSLYTINILWSHVFPEMKETARWDEALGRYIMRVTANDLADTMQQFFGCPAAGARDVALPAAAWIEEALRTLTEIGMAAQNSDGSFDVRYSDIKADTIGYFARRIVAEEKRKKRKQGEIQHPNQQKLFAGTVDGDATPPKEK